MNVVDPSPKQQTWRPQMHGICPRCGVERCISQTADRGKICRDCRSELSPEERAVWG